MSFKILYYCCLQGKSFDPLNFVSIPNIHIEGMHQIGEECDYGRFKNRKSELGYIRFCNYKSEFGSFSEFEVFLDLLLKDEIQQEIQKADDGELHITLLYQDQCNWELSVEDLEKIRDIGLNLTISADLV